MAEMQESWKEVASKAEALGLKLKLHLEQERDESEPRAEGDTKAMIDEFAQKLTDAFDSMGHAAKDPAVHEDVKDVGRLLRDALVTTFNKVGDEVTSRAPGMHSDDDAADETPQDVLDETAGDESEGSDA